MAKRWEFWIDVGGTFTDCIGRSPDGGLIQCKTLSSGITKGIVGDGSSVDRIIDNRRTERSGFWIGYTIRLIDADAEIIHVSQVARSEAGALEPERPIADVRKLRGLRYELSSHEEAPIVAIRRMLNLTLDAIIPRTTVRLGTTRGTNALLTRSGARTAFVTTRGFADVLLIANQDRPRLFDLAIHKPEPVFERVVEIDERLDADGNVLTSPDETSIRRQLAELCTDGIESLAICLLHSFANNVHEELVAQIASEVGFEEISVSSRLSPLIRIVSRGDTTTVDAYLNPILRRYVQSLRDSLPDSDLKIMTSAGGVVDANHFVGKDSILSGPAGGVVGSSRVAQQAGFEKSIGFDMGGTSTDVSRFDGRYDLEFETQKAGVRVVSPMLAIETVAAGGGSICGFDGVKLSVGPNSAGADPGPACYGRGGPLTVTDLNVFLGRIIAERFPFPLNLKAIDSRLTGMCDAVEASPLGRRYTPVELAEGLLEIANANMVRAIRRVSVAKGYDPADYALVSFGGAGSQHACAMARSLGIGRVLIHPFSGILSAWGIGQADVRRFRDRSILKPCSHETLAQLEPVFVELERSATDAVRADGVADDRIRAPIRSLDLRYQGTDSAIAVTKPDDNDYPGEFERLHEQLYGYIHSGRPVEITAARVEVIGEAETSIEESHALRQRRPQPHESRIAIFDGSEHSAGVFLREQLHPGDEIDGPAIVCEPTSTVVVEPGFAASVTERNEILLKAETGDGTPSRREDVLHEKSSGPKRAPFPLSTPDPVQLEIFNNLFASIAEQMGVTLQKTSFSTNVRERLDFSCAVFDAQGNLVVNAPHIPVHLGAMSETVKRVIADNPDLAPGDVFVTNDPYRGGSHLPDVTVVTPIHAKKGVGSLFRPDAVEPGETSDRKRLPTPLSHPIFFTASRAHHAEIGGIVPGSMPPFSKRLDEEGVLIRNFRLVDRGESREAALKELLLSNAHPTRSVDDNLADVAAQVAANNSGVRLLGELVERYSLPVVQAYMMHIQQAAAEKMRMALSRIDDGEYHRTDCLDDGSPITARITIRGERATVDFTGTGPVLETNLNANQAITTAAVLYVFRCLIADDIPLNSGVLEPVEIILPECLLNPPEHDDPAECAAIVGGNVETSQRIVDTLLRALKVAACSQGTMNNLTFGDETFGYYETICGGSGATPDAPGADAVHTHMTNTRLTDVEVIERRYPVRVGQFGIRHGSGGSGTYRGGDGVVREIEFLRPLKVSMLSERRGTFAPAGLAGGAPGTIGRNTLRRADASPARELGGKFAIEVRPGDILRIETPGGGGCV